MISPSTSYTITIRIEGKRRIGLIHELLGVIARVGGMIGAIDIIDVGTEHWIRDFHVHCENTEHEQRIVGALKGIGEIEIRQVSDETFQMHRGGKLTVESKFPLTNRSQLSMAYTPGVGRVSSFVAADPRRSWELTIKKNTIAVVSDGSAVLGLGDLGPAGAMPVMEGKAQLFKCFGGVDAFPLCIAEKDPDKIVEFCRQIAPTFGGINLEDISAPRCFYIEDRLKELVDIPVFHDDQHGTAVVVLAALKNALKLVDKPMEAVRVALIGIGAAGVACAKILLQAGVGDIVGVDRRGILGTERDYGENQMKKWFAEHTNREGRQGGVKEALAGADLLLGLSGPGLVEPAWLKRMSRDPIVFAMANPVPEVMPEDAAPLVAVMATGRSDYPNQINNVLCFPGIFRGALDSHARDINEQMKLAAAEAIAGCVTEKKLGPDYIIPSVFDRQVTERVARAVTRAAHDSGAAQRRPPLLHDLPDV